jgi:hypothetical protein
MLCCDTGKESFLGGVRVLPVLWLLRIEQQAMTCLLLPAFELLLGLYELSVLKVANYGICTVRHLALAIEEPATELPYPVLPIREFHPGLSIGILVIDFIVLELSDVSPSIGPPELSVTVHVVVAPGAVVGPPIWPLIEAQAFEHAHLEVAFVVAAVAPSEVALSLLLAIGIDPWEESSIKPGLIDCAVLHIHFPITTIVAAVRMVVISFPLALPFFPFSVVNVAIWMYYSAPAVMLVVKPLPLINGAFEPDHDSEAVAYKTRRVWIKSLLALCFVVLFAFVLVFSELPFVIADSWEFFYLNFVGKVRLIFVPIKQASC